ncbi:MAG: diiron oxygenase [Parafilimonas sp.]
MDTATIERLTRISIERPLMPETYIPWNNPRTENERFLPESFISVTGLPVYDKLTEKQILEIERHEAVQFMYSYAWSEALGVKFLSREIVKLNAGSAETKFMYREIIEETRHMEMFNRGIEVINGHPILPSNQHFFWSKISSKYLPNSMMFMAMIAGEFVSDAVGRAVQKDEKVYSVLRKIAELHQIEEGRHIYFAKKYLEDYTKNAGFIKRSIYSIIMALHIHFMITMYVKKEIFQRAGIADVKTLYKCAKKNYRNNFSNTCLKTAIEFVKEFNGFNRITKPFWKRLLNAKID